MTEYEKYQRRFRKEDVMRQLACFDSEGISEADAATIIMAEVNRKYSRLPIITPTFMKRLITEYKDNEIAYTWGGKKREEVITQDTNYVCADRQINRHYGNKSFADPKCPCITCRLGMARELEAGLKRTADRFEAEGRTDLWIIVQGDLEKATIARMKVRIEQLEHIGQSECGPAEFAREKAAKLKNKLKEMVA